MLESIEELRTFCRIVDEGSLSAAARSLALSVNAVSRRLAQLETRLGTRLAERTTRTLRLTDDGQRFYDRCQRILAEVEDAEQTLAPAERGLAGLVRVAVHPTAAHPAMLTELGVLREEHPRLRVHLLARNAPVDPVREGVDILVWSGEVTMQSVVARRILETSWVLACAPSYAERRGVPKRPRDLADHVCLRALRDRPERVWVLRDAKGRDVQARPGGRIDCDDTETLRRALYAGLGIGFRPPGEVKREARAGRLVPVLPRHGLRPVAVHLVTPPGRLRLRRVRAMAELLEKALRAVM
ncbi:MAG: LysR family transcriptional regulator [Polyangiaceae bacterium]